MAAKLKQTKTIHLTHLSRTMNTLEEHLNDEPPNQSNISKYLKMLKEKYEKVVEKSELLQDELTDADQLEKEINEMDELENKVIDIQHRGEETLEDIKESKVKKLDMTDAPDALNATLGLIEKLKEDSETSREKFATETLNATLQLIEKLKEDSNTSRERSLLPPLSIARFDGNIEKYEEFIDSFEAIVEKHAHVEDVEKFIFLKSHLDKPASELLEGFSTTNSDYKEALKLFKDTYGNKSLLRKIRISKLLNIERHDGKTSLRSKYNKIRTNLRSLEGLDINTEDYSLFLIPIVCSKLSRDMNKKWYKRNDESINNLLTFIQEEVESTESAIYLEDAFASSTTPKQKDQTDKKRYSDYNSNHRYSRDSTYKGGGYKQDHNYNNRGDYRPSTATALHTSTNKWCYYCQADNHDTQNCRRLSNITSTDVRGFLNSQQLCYCCMKKNHSTAQCYHKATLECKTCKSNTHHTFLHVDKPVSNNKEPSQTGSGKPIKLSTVTNIPPIKTILFQTANANLKNDKHQTVKAKLLFDPCSDRSYITTEASRRIKLKYHDETLAISGFNGKSEEAQCYKVRHAIIQSLHMSESRCVQLVETNKICPSIHREAIPSNLLDCRYLQGIYLAEDYTKSSDDEIDVLIGLDYYWDFVTGKVKRQRNKPVAVESILGWMLQGNGGVTPANRSNPTALFTSTKEATEITQQLKKFWELEEVQNSEDVQWSREETMVHNNFKETITYEGKEGQGRYQVKLPVKDNISKLSSNKAGARSRLKGLQNRFNKNPELGAQYREVIHEYIDNDFVEEVVEDTEPETCFYLPHHPVIKEDRSTTKIRPVFDGSASDENTESLNDYLYTGPNLQTPLNEILMRFRLNPIAFTADVKKMFLMIKLHPDNRDLLRFFWEDQVDRSLKIYRFTVLPFGLSCSPYLAKATVQHHVSTYKEKYPHIVEEIITNTYMDDLLTGAQSVEEAVGEYETERQIMKEGGMQLLKWKSNSPELIEKFITDKVCSEEDQKELDSETAILGISWKNKQDCFTFHEKGILNSHTDIRLTKRNILKVTGKLYDPPGWLSPYIVTVKILIQMLWERGLEWDEAVPLDLQSRWEEWKAELNLLSSIEIPRYIGSIHKQHTTPIELHTFGDASESAYASACYLKSIDEDGEVHITLMNSKTKVAPIKLVSLPRLELLAAVLAAKTAHYVNTSLQIPDLKMFMWTDAKVTLQWIRSNSRQYKTFVANRIQLIQEHTDPSTWRWCPGDQNPADIPSRGCSLTKLLEDELWRKGPPWLQHTEDQYPDHMEDLSSSNVVKKEVRSKYICLVTTASSKTATIKAMTTKLIDPKNYSKLKTLLTTTAYVNRYLHNISNQKANRITGPLVAEEYEDAKKQWLQVIQQHSFAEELNLLKEGKNVKKTSHILKLSPYYDEVDGLIKMGGRLQFSDLSEEEKHPIILPNQSYIVKLIAKDTHQRQLHAGINQTLISLRYRYWILRGRQLVKRIVKSCFICRKINPVRLQVQTAPLPKDRIQQCMPFEVVGIDFTGPLYVYQGMPKLKYDPDLKRQVLSYDNIPCNKMYICLFTCGVIRAVHLELLWDLTTESFTQSFRRFISTRGMCRTIYSDNAKTFQKAEKDIKFYLELLKGKAFQKYMKEQNIQWKYILECSPWWGGFYERLMKSIKQPLKKILGKSRINVDEMSTILKEIEAQINSRPITDVSDEPSEQNYLTPASFLIGRSTMNMPLKPRITKRPKPEQRMLNTLLKQQNKFLDTIWRSWREEYLRNLGTVNNQINHSDCVKVGELVMVGHQNLPRTTWEVGVIEDLKEGRDQRVRTAFVRTTKGVIPRSVQHLSRLEADSLEDYNQYAC